MVLQTYKLSKADYCQKEIIDLQIVALFSNRFGLCFLTVEFIFDLRSWFEIVYCAFPRCSLLTRCFLHFLLLVDKLFSG